MVASIWIVMRFTRMNKTRMEMDTNTDMTRTTMARIAIADIVAMEAKSMKRRDLILGIGSIRISVLQKSNDILKEGGRLR